MDNGSVPLRDLGPVLGIHHLVDIRFVSDGLEAGGPEVTGLSVPQDKERSPAIARGILPPAGDSKISPPAESGAGRGDHDGVAAVGEEVGAGCDVVGGFESPQGRRNDVSHQGCLPYLLAPGPGHGHGTRSPLLEQEFRGLHEGMRVKTPSHDAVVNHIVQSNDGHALVMGHVCPNHRHASVFGQPRGSEIEGLIEPVHTSGAGFGQIGRSWPALPWDPPWPRVLSRREPPPRPRTTLA